MSFKKSDSKVYKKPTHFTNTFPKFHLNMNRQQKNTVPTKQRTNKGNNPQVRSTPQVRSQDSQDNALQVHSTHQVRSRDNTP